MKFLGVKLDSNLNFSAQLQHVCSKVSKTAGILFRISKFVPLNTLIKLYYSLIYPYILYGILIWGGSADTHLNSLFLIQKRIIRCITCSDRLSSTQPLFQKCKILKLRDVYKLSMGTHMYQRYTSGDINYPSHGYDTRSRNIAVPLTNDSLKRSDPSLTQDLRCEIQYLIILKIAMGLKYVDSLICLQFMVGRVYGFFSKYQIINH